MVSFKKEITTDVYDEEREIPKKKKRVAAAHKKGDERTDISGAPSVKLRKVQQMYHYDTPGQAFLYVLGRSGIEV